MGVHWLAWNISPSRTEIPQDWTPSDARRNDFDETGYSGPDPPDRTHTYRFKLYALETQLDLSGGETKTALGLAMKDSVFAMTQLEGTYSPSPITRLRVRMDTASTGTHREWRPSRTL